jgi:uncharacterized protein YyaL (SSP411 family)
MSVWLTPPEESGPAWSAAVPCRDVLPARATARHAQLPAGHHGCSQAWHERPADIRTHADRITDAIRQHLAASTDAAAVGEATVTRAVEHLLRTFDEAHGGFGGAPKFPQPVFLDLLLDAREADLLPEQSERLDHAIHYTLTRMAMGGMYDQVGGGFHRYSVDARWLVPHFEKMLYDNGMLASTYSRAYELTADPLYAAIAREICEYVLREMTDETGAYFSAQDAEVNAREGLSYLWSEPQINEALPDADAAFARRIYGLDRGTNFQDPHDPSAPAANVLYLPEPPDKLAASFDMSVGEFHGRVARAIRKLREARDERDQPGLDDKILTSWNGLMIAGMADGGAYLGKDKYIEAASRAADFVLERMNDPQDGLRRTWRRSADEASPEARLPASLEDYAFMIRGLIALYRATGEQTRLGQAVSLAAQARKRFWNETQGGYFDTEQARTDLIVRSRGSYDGALPSGSGVMLGGLLDLAELTREPHYLDDAIATVRSLSHAMDQNPAATVNALRHVLRIAREHPDLLPGAEGAVPLSDQTPVEVRASTGRVELVPGRAASLEVGVLIADGIHLNAHEPGDPNLIGLHFALAGGEGVRLTAEYPEGEAYGQDGEIRIYRHAITIPLTLEVTGNMSGAPKLVMTYQACTESECLAPAHLLLDIDIVGP